MMNASARRPNWAPAAVFLGCLFLTATPAFGQRFVPDEDNGGSGGVSLGVLVGVGLDDDDSEESGRYIAVDVRLVRPLGDVLGGGASGPFRGKRFEVAAPRRRAADTGGSVGVGVDVTLGVEGRDTWVPPETFRKQSGGVQQEGLLDHGGTVFGVVNALVVLPVFQRVQVIPFAGLGPYLILENDSPEEGTYSIANQWGLVVNYGIEAAIPFGRVDLRLQYRAFRYDAEALEYVTAEGEAFEQEIDPVRTSAFLVGIGVNF